MIPNVHADLEGFRAALEFTSRSTGFRIDLIEKDYYCSVVLSYIYSIFDGSLIFKGGTSLNKVHVGFYRLSEDLDFSIPIAPNASRSERGKAVTPIKKIISDLPAMISVFTLRRELIGTNESRQYNCEIEYNSAFGAGKGTIKFEIGLRELNERDPIEAKAGTVLLNPFTGKVMVPGITVKTLSKIEAYSEKMRAALTRKEPAIRDWFDLEHAIAADCIDIENKEYLDLVRKKLQLPGTPEFQSMDGYRSALTPQMEAELRPVLRDTDYNSFSLENAISRITKVIERLS